MDAGSNDTLLQLLGEWKAALLCQTAACMTSQQGPGCGAGV
jgi:hypothetical protein